MNATHAEAVQNIAVIGAGSWGTALADLLAAKGYAVDLWAYEDEVARQISEYRENRVFLPGALLSPNITAQTDLARATVNHDFIVIAVPSHVMRHVSTRMAPSLSSDAILVSASKGIENKTHLTMSGILQQTLPHVDKRRLAALSGPTFAKEVVRRIPTAVTVASASRRTAETAQRVMAGDTFRVYTNDDLIGVELGGSLKNVIAVATGISDGLGFGANSRAALMTRGLAEIQRLGLRLGANPHTLSGLAGIGDLILTCTSNLSRNYTVGYKIGQGQRPDEILKDMRMVAEGVKTARSVYNLSHRLGVDMPISSEVYRILYENSPPADALLRLMTRDLKQEMDAVV